jgi:hypothetical protein
MRRSEPTRPAQKIPAPPSPDDAAAPGNRKLIRPRLHDRPQAAAPRRGAVDVATAWQEPGRERRKPPPAEGTGVEAAHWSKQENLRTPMVFTLEGGDVLHGVVQWHDRDSLGVRRDDGVELLLMKHAIIHSSREVSPTSRRSEAVAAPRRRPR